MAPVRPPGSVQGGAHRRDLQMMSGEFERRYVDPFGAPYMEDVYTCDPATVGFKEFPFYIDNPLFLVRVKGVVSPLTIKQMRAFAVSEPEGMAMHRMGIYEDNGLDRWRLVKASEWEHTRLGAVHYQYPRTFTLHPDRRYLVGMRVAHAAGLPYPLIRGASLVGAYGNYIAGGDVDAGLPEEINTSNASSINVVPFVLLSPTTGNTIY